MISMQELNKAYKGLNPDSDTRSEHLSALLMRIYDFEPTNEWFNVYAHSLTINLGNRSILAPVGTEIVFFVKNPTGWEVVGAGVIENTAGLMKFTPIYLYNSFNDHGAHPQQDIVVYVFGFEFLCTPAIKAQGFGTSVCLESLTVPDENAGEK